MPVSIRAMIFGHIVEDDGLKAFNQSREPFWQVCVGHVTASGFEAIPRAIERLSRRGFDSITERIFYAEYASCGGQSVWLLARRVGTRHVRSGHDLKGQPNVCDTPGHRTDMVEVRRKRHCALNGHGAEGRLESENPTKTRRSDD
jgi:hypothetical protein